MAKITVVIPLYNKVLHIARAIQSVLGQTEQDFEIIVVNDASRDGGEKIVEGFKDGRIRLLHRDTPGPGGHAARNLGIKESRSDLISFLDADDSYKPAFIETILRLRKNFSEAGAYTTAYELIEQEGIIRNPRYFAIPASPWEGLIPNYFKSLLGEAPIWTSATAIPKEVFYKVGLFPEGVRIGGDLDMWLRVALSYRIAHSTSIQSIYYRNATNRVCLVELPPVEEHLFAKTAMEAIKSGRLSQEDSNFLKEYINKFKIMDASRFISLGYKELGIKRLQECDTVMLRHYKLKWLRLSKLPTFLFKFLLFVKIHILNRFFKGYPHSQ